MSAHISTVQITFSGERNALDSLDQCEQLLDLIVSGSGLTKLETAHHQFVPQGVSIIQLLAESHIALHTWPEVGRGYVVLTTCRSDDLNLADFEPLFAARGLQIKSALPITTEAL